MAQKITRYFSALLLLLALASARADTVHQVNVARCQEQFASLVNEPADAGHAYAMLSEPAHAEKRAFLEQLLLPTVGLRAIFREFSQPRPLTLSEHEMRIGGFGDTGQDLIVRWNGTGSEPRHYELANGTLVLEFPRGFDVRRLREEGRFLIQRWLTGHSLHPNIRSPEAERERAALGEPAFFHREVQMHGMQAGVEAIRAGDRSYLFVGPTGVGKTEVLRMILRERVLGSMQPRQPRLHVLTAHMDSLVGDLAKATREALAAEIAAEQVIVIDKDQFQGMTIEQLTALARRGRPVILVTTSQAFQQRVDSGAGREANVTTLRRVLGTFVIDEAHHLGAPELSAIVTGLMNREAGSRAFLYGTTATPTHEQLPRLQALFGDRAFYAYLDTPQSYRRGEGSTLDRSIGLVIDQLSEAIRRGELQPFRHYALNPNGDNFRNLYIQNASRQWIINPEAYDTLTRAILPRLRAHNRGFFAVSNVTEANDYARSLRTFLTAENAAGRYPRVPVIEVLHSSMPKAARDAILARFKSGATDFLVTVRMLDEGVDVPDATLYIDFNRHIPARQRLQRLGRILRMAEGQREPVEMITIPDITDADTVRLLVALGRAERAGNREPPEPREPQRPEDTTFQSLLLRPEQMVEHEAVFWERLRARNRAAAAAVDNLFTFAEAQSFVAPFTDGRRRSPQSNRMISLVHELLDETTGNRRQLFEMAMAGGAANRATARANIAAYAEARRERARQLESRVGAVRFVRDFIERYERLPGHESDGRPSPEAHLTAEERALASRLQEWRRMPEFYAELSATGGNSPTSLYRHLQITTESLRAAMASPQTVAAFAQAYFEHPALGRMPLPSPTDSIERTIAQQMRAHPTFVTHLVGQRARAAATRPVGTSGPSGTGGSSGSVVAPVSVPVREWAITSARLADATPERLEGFRISLENRIAAIRTDPRQASRLRELQRALVLVTDLAASRDTWGPLETAPMGLPARNAAQNRLHQATTAFFQSENLSILAGDSPAARPPAVRISIRARQTGGINYGFRNLTEFIQTASRTLGFTVVEESSTNEQVVLRVTGQEAALFFGYLNGQSVSIRPRNEVRTTNNADLTVTPLDARNAPIASVVPPFGGNGPLNLRFDFHGGTTIRDRLAATGAVRVDPENATTLDAHLRLRLWGILQANEAAAR